MDKEKATTCIQVLQDWGYKVKPGKTLGSDSATYFSGTDDERLADLQEMLDDDAVKGILSSRSGYGTGGMFDRLSFTPVRPPPQ